MGFLMAATRATTATAAMPAFDEVTHAHEQLQQWGKPGQTNAGPPTIKCQTCGVRTIDIPRFAGECGGCADKHYSDYDSH